MKKTLSIILAGLMLASAAAFVPVSADEAPVYTYNAFSNAVIVNAGVDVVIDNADEITALAKENSTSNVIVTSLGKPTLDFKISDAALSALDEAELAVKITLADANVILDTDVIAELSEKTESEFVLSLDSTDGLKATLKCDSEAAVLENPMTAVCEADTADINNVIANGASVGMAYISGRTWYMSVKNDVEAKATYSEAPEFDDIKLHWGRDSINYVTAKGYFNGVEPGKFKPDNKMTRGMVVTVLSRIDGAPDSELTYTYTDVDESAWFAKGVNWAYKNGIVEGGEAFRPDEDVTRLELMEMLYKYAEKLGLSAVDPDAKEFVFVDYDLLTTDLSRAAVEFCTSNGIVNGYSIGDGSTHRLRPAGQANRAEVSAMIQRFMNHVTAGGFEMGDIMGKYSDFITVRSDLTNLYNKLNSGEEVVVSYFGGSVTAGFGSSNANELSWRGLTYNWLKTNFPNAKLVQNNVAQGGSGSHLGAFRVGVDVIDMDTDLLFIEFAINDNYSSTTAENKVELYFESTVRQVREALPECDIIAVYTTDSGQVTKYGESTMHPSAAAQDKVCEHYGITSVDVGRALARHMGGYNSSWSTYFKDIVHPLDAGYKVFADAIIEYMGEYLLGEPSLAYGETKAYTVPEGYVDERNETFKPEYIQVNSEDIFDELKGFTLVPDGEFLSITKTRGYIYPSENDNSFTFTFEGTALDMYLEFSGGGYMIEYSVDGGEPKKLSISNTNHPFKLVGGLEYGKHTVTYSYKGETGNGGTSTARKICALMVSGVK